MERKNMVRAVIDPFIQNPRFNENTLREEKILQEIINEIKNFIHSHHPEISPVEFDLQMDSEHNCFNIRIISRDQGREKISQIDFDLLSSPEFEEMKKLAQEVRVFGSPPFRLEEDGNGLEVKDFSELINVVFTLGKKGLEIQRYKGLGEMNPAQLWETTMNPETRTILQVKVEDAVEADAIFTVLMGDEVEPRREFIYQNALDVKNLDV
jgi:DNA gyrase subunit B